MLFDLIKTSSDTNQASVGSDGVILRDSCFKYDEVDCGFQIVDVRYPQEIFIRSE